MTGSSALIAQAAALFRGAKTITAFTGAGISTPSGIPDFRSPESGLWEHADPMAVASIYGFRSNPAAFYRWVHPLAELTLRAEPNPAHIALARLEAIGYLSAVITQNIDMLHHRAGSRIVYELHGHFREVTCTHCFHVFDGEPVLRQFLVDREIPRCPLCSAVLKPNVILFGEQLPFQVLRQAQDVARSTDLMLVVGSSLEVAPASDIPLLARSRGAKLIIVNLESTLLDNAADVLLRADAAIVLPEIVRILEQLS
jgi:NAD-dependent deacetylase